MKNVNGILSLVAVLGLLSGCGRQTTALYWNGTAWVSSLSSSGSSAATATPTQIYAMDGNGNLHLFSITVATGNLSVMALPASQTFNTVQVIVAGVWTYEVNAITHSIDLYSTSNLNVIVESFTVATGITAISIAQ